MTDPTSDLEHDLVELIVDEISLDPDAPLDAQTDLLLTGLVDSLGVVQIVGWLEDRLAVTIEPTDVVLENFQTVERMVRFSRSLVVAD